MSDKNSNGLSQEMIAYLDARMGGLRYEAPSSETTPTVYMGTEHPPAETKFDEASGQVLMNVDGLGWVQMISSGGGSSISGDLRVDAGAGINWGGSRVIAEPGPGYLQAMSTLNKLVAAVEAGACCRCAPTEVCPECHDLNLALDSAKKTLDAFSQPMYSAPPASNTVTLQGSYTGTTTVPGSILTVATSGSSAGLTIKAGT